MSNDDIHTEFSFAFINHLMLANSADFQTNSCTILYIFTSDPAITTSGDMMKVNALLSRDSKTKTYTELSLILIRIIKASR